MRMVYILSIVAIIATLFCEPKTEPVNVPMTVTRGDTVWDLVAEAMYEVGDKREIQEVIYETKKLNKLKYDELPIGAVIVIPCEVEVK